MKTGICRDLHCRWNFSANFQIMAALKLYFRLFDLPSFTLNTLIFICFMTESSTVFACTIGQNTLSYKARRKGCLDNKFLIYLRKHVLWIFIRWLPPLEVLYGGVSNEYLQHVVVEKYITKTRVYNFDPLKPHFYIVKLGFTWIYINCLMLLKT